MDIRKIHCVVEKGLIIHTRKDGGKIYEPFVRIEEPWIGNFIRRKFTYKILSANWHTKEPALRWESRIPTYVGSEKWNSEKEALDELDKAIEKYLVGLQEDDDSIIVNEKVKIINN